MEQKEELPQVETQAAQTEPKRILTRLKSSQGTTEAKAVAESKAEVEAPNIFVSLLASIFLMRQLQQKPTD